MTQINYLDKQYFIPGSWNELTAKHLLLYCKLFMDGKLTAGVKNTQALIRINLLIAFTGMRAKHFLAIPKQEREEKLYPALDFLFNDIALTQNKLPVLRSKRVTLSLSNGYLYGPEDGLDKVRALEFAFADGWFLNYTKTGKDEFLHMLIAVLYRPRKASHLVSAIDYDGDKRQKFNQYYADKQVKWAANLKPEVKHAIFLFYMGARKEQELLNPEMFTKTVNAKVNKLGWKEVINAMAGPKFGTITDTNDALISELFTEICINIRKQNAQKN